MRHEIIYSNSEVLKQKIDKGHFIPYHVVPSQRYQRNSIYYNDYWNMCYRVINADYEPCGDLKSIYVKADDRTYHWISTELSYSDYLLRKDEKEIYKIEDVVNLNYSLTGAEIIYWFYTHKITHTNPKYKGFWKFIDIDSANRISDYARYFVNAQINEKGNYYQCTMQKVINPDKPLYSKIKRKKVEWK